jgi:hypothetical protein
MPNTILGEHSVLLPTGTTAQRPGTPAIGMLRYNTTIGSLEQYMIDGWQAVTVPPAISTVSPATFNGEQGTQFTINGSFFDATATVFFLANNGNGTSYQAATVTRDSSTQLRATTPRDFTVAEEPLAVQVVNGSGISVVLANAIDCGGSPTWSTASGSVATLYDGARTINVTLVATDPDAGATISYSLVSGSLPPGVTLNSNGTLTGTASAVGSNTTYNFTARATDNAGNIADRAFSITVNAPQVSAYAFTGGDQSFTVPSGLTSFFVKLWGAGGGGPDGSQSGGGGGHASGNRASSGGQVYTVRVGGAGGTNCFGNCSNQNSGGGFGGGGGAHEGSGGGGGSFLFLGGTGFANIVAAAGGGGGGGGGTSGNNGGAGGGDSGQAGGGGAGGTQNSGSQLNGGGGSSGGGGGGGYRGGSGGFRAGSWLHYSGGGGSGHVGGLTGATNQAGNRNTPGGSADGDRSGAGNIRSNGRVVIRF